MTHTQTYGVDPPYATAMEGPSAPSLVHTHSHSDNPITNPSAFGENQTDGQIRPTAPSFGNWIQRPQSLINEMDRRDVVEQMAHHHYQPNGNVDGGPYTFNGHGLNTDSPLGQQSEQFERKLLQQRQADARRQIPNGRTSESIEEDPPPPPYAAYPAAGIGNNERGRGREQTRHQQYIQQKAGISINITNRYSGEEHTHGGVACDGNNCGGAARRENHDSSPARTRSPTPNKRQPSPALRRSDGREHSPMRDNSPGNRSYPPGCKRKEQAQHKRYVETRRTYKSIDRMRKCNLDHTEIENWTMVRGNGSGYW